MNKAWFSKYRSESHLVKNLVFCSQIFWTNFNFLKYCIKNVLEDFPGGPVVKNLSANKGDNSLIPCLGRFHMPHGSWACAPQLLSPRT